jgi:hypothetical protein
MTTQELIASLPAGAMNFTTRNGKTIQMEAQNFPFALLATLYRLQEDYEQRGQFLTLEGVMREIFGMGVDTQRARWKWGAINKETKVLKSEFEKDIQEVLKTGDAMTPEEKLAHVTELFNTTQNQIHALRRTKR